MPCASLSASFLLLFSRKPRLSPTEPTPSHLNASYSRHPTFPCFPPRLYSSFAVSSASSPVLPRPALPVPRPWPSVLAGASDLVAGAAGYPLASSSILRLPSHLYHVSLDDSPDSTFPSPFSPFSPLPPVPAPRFLSLYNYIIVSVPIVHVPVPGHGSPSPLPVPVSAPVTVTPFLNLKRRGQTGVGSCARSFWLPASPTPCLQR